ncbi:MAG: glycoside hydrolase family 172 protein [Promethearchaeati archaeon]
MKLGKSSLNDIAKLRPDGVKRRRLSSYDLYGGNHDWIDIEPGKTVILGEYEGSGCITHIWCTCMSFFKNYLRHVIIRMYWDGETEDTPSVEVPLGDFFGMGHAERENFVSLPLQMSPQNGKGFNCWFPMPFSQSFKITLENDTSKNFRLYYYIDYEIYEESFDNAEEYGRFHAQWRRENPTDPKKIDLETGKKFSKLRPFNFNVRGGRNRNPLERNYTILEAKGKGHYVGCHLDIDNQTFMPWFLNWPGEGDDMIFIDDDIDHGIITLPGTGTEDYVNQAFCPRQKQSTPYHGTIKPGGFNFFGKITYYRYHIEDPIYFNKKIIVCIEHGHDNHRADDWSSTAYWYQKEPHDHLLYPALLDRNGREPNSHLSHILRKTLCILILLGLLSWILIWPLIKYLMEIFS